MKKILAIQLIMLTVILSCNTNGGTRLTNGKDSLVNPISHADVERWLVAWNSHNIDTIDALFSDGALIYQPQNPQPLTKKTMNPFFEMVFKTYPDIKFESVAITVEGREAVSWENVTGTMTANFTDPVTGQVLQPNGKRFKYEVAKRIEYDESHKIKEVHIIFDELILSRQLDLPLK